MSRPPNFATSQWFRPREDSWVIEANCGAWRNLPWTDEQQPDPSTLEEMRSICDGCPVIRRCAQDALEAHHGLGADGGMYAGVWLPWRTHRPGRRAGDARLHARVLLRRVARSGSRELAKAH